MKTLGGQFAFKSVYKKGSIFEFSIPLDKYDYVSPVFDEDMHQSDTQNTNPMQKNTSSNSGVPISSQSQSDYTVNFQHF